MLGSAQAYLAEYTGFSTSFISNPENGKETAELGKAILLMNLLGIDLEAVNKGEQHERISCIKGTQTPVGTISGDAINDAEFTYCKPEVLHNAYCFLQVSVL